MSDFTICQTLMREIENTENFKLHFTQFLAQSNTHNHNNLISRVFVHIRNVLEMYESIGYVTFEAQTHARY